MASLWNKVWSAVLLATVVAILPAQTMSDELVVGGLLQPVGIEFANADLLFVWERRGIVRVIDHGVMLPTPLLDITEEVGNWRDFGLLGFALDPAFATNGRFYLAYVVDRHHLQHFGTPSYDSRASDYFSATIVRVTRYAADPATGFKTTLAGSRQVLLGESITTGVPSTYNSHGACTLLFGRDGTLLVATGDGASFLGFDIGSHSTTYWQQALADGMLTPATNVGAFRSQQIDSLCGKVLRIDPATGDGVPSNPFFQPGSPRSARSRVWALGFRNPCRMTLRPGTGATDPSLGQPGELFVGDVGASTYEELSIVDHAGQNCGWPLFQGMDANGGFVQALVDNQFAANPLAGGGCGAWFRFQDLLRQANTAHTQFFPNPCNPAIGIAPTTPTFVHRLPVLDWKHGAAEARVAVFNGVAPTFEMIGTPASGVTGTPFFGNASIAGTWHSGLSFPAGYGPCYYQADFGGNWIRRLQFSGVPGHEQELLGVHDFATVSTPIMLAEHPRDHSLYYISYSAAEVRRISFGIEPRPTAVVQADRTFGPGQLDVQLDGRASSDPQGQALTYLWDLGNGRRSTAPQLEHKFLGNGSPSVANVSLTVTDTAGAQSTTTVPIAIDNTPPRVQITSLRNGDQYPLTSSTTVTLQAAVTDAEHAPAQLGYAWQTTLYHGNHLHSEPVDTRVSPTVVVSPTPLDGEYFAYRVRLTVTDAGGLQGSDEVWLFPDAAAAPTQVAMTSPLNGDRFLPGASVALAAVVTGPVQRVEYFADGELIGLATAAPWAVTWTPTEPGRRTIVAVADAGDGTGGSSRPQAIQVEVPRHTQCRVAGIGGDAHEALTVGALPDLGNRTLVLGDDGSPRVTGLLFQPRGVPLGARVLGAHIEFTANGANSDAASLQVACQDAAAPAPIVASAGNLAGRPVRGAVIWNPAPWSANQAAAAQRTPDLGAAIAPLVASAKWSQNLMFLVRGTGHRRAWSYDGNAPVSPLLTIEWLPPLPPAWSQAIVVGADDATEGMSSGVATATQPTLPLGTSAGVAQLTGLRWTLPLPRGARILSAHVRFTAAAVSSGHAHLAFRHQVADNAPSFVNTRYNLTSRPRSIATVPWAVADWTAIGQSARSPDLSALVQAVVDRAGWQAGNGLVLFLQGTGGRLAQAFEAGNASRPVLEVEYEAPGK